MSLDAKDIELLKSIFGENKTAEAKAVDARSAAAKDTRDSKNAIFIVGMILTALGPLLASVVLFVQASATRLMAEDTKRIAVESSDTLKNVEHLVNATSSAAVAEIKALKETILQMSVSKAVDEEREREATSKNKPKPAPTP